MPRAAVSYIAGVVDWLAEKICLETIDDGFIQEQLDYFNSGEPVHGVLDPACGSGTGTVVRAPS